MTDTTNATKPATMAQIRKALRGLACTVERCEWGHLRCCRSERRGMDRHEFAERCVEALVGSGVQAVLLESWAVGHPFRLGRLGEHVVALIDA